jgi:hypothetical protein
MMGVDQASVTPSLSRPRGSRKVRLPASLPVSGYQALPAFAALHDSCSSALSSAEHRYAWGRPPNCRFEGDC